MEDCDRLSIGLAIPDDQRAIIMTGHELLAIVEPTDRAHRLRGAIEAHLTLSRAHIPQYDQPTIKADHELGRVKGMITQMDDFTGFRLLRQLYHIVPFDVVAGLREVVVHIEDIGVALLRANVDPTALEWERHGRHSFVYQFLREDQGRLLLTNVPEGQCVVIAVGDQCTFIA